MLYIVLIGAVSWLIYKAHEFERFSKFEQLIVPFYAFFTFLSTMDWTLQNTVQAVVIVILAFFISDYQLKDVELKKGEDRRGRPAIFIKKNRSYVIGWLAVLTLGVLFNISFAEHVDSEHLLTELLRDLKKEVLVFTTFTTDSPWYIWLLTSLTTYFYTYRLFKRQAKKFKEAFGGKSLKQIKKEWRDEESKRG